VEGGRADREECVREVHSGESVAPGELPLPDLRAGLRNRDGLHARQLPEGAGLPAREGLNAGLDGRALDVEPLYVVADEAAAVGEVAGGGDG